MENDLNESKKFKKTLANETVLYIRFKPTFRYLVSLPRKKRARTNKVY